MAVQRELAADVEAVFQCEVPGVESMHLRIRQIARIGLAALRGEENIVLSPEDQGLRLTLLEILLLVQVVNRLRP